jgi:hypothetical protein
MAQFPSGVEIQHATLWSVREVLRHTSKERATTKTGGTLRCRSTVLEAHGKHAIQNQGSGSIQLLIFSQYSLSFTTYFLLLVPLVSFLHLLVFLTSHSFIMYNLQVLYIALSGLLDAAYASDLRDLPPPSRAATLDRRQNYGPDYSCLDLQSEEVFTWGGK